MEPGSVLLRRVNPIQSYQVQLDRQVQGSAEPFDQGDNAGLGADVGCETYTVG